MERLEILKSIDQLHEEHEHATDDRKKEIDKEIRELGEKLKIPRRVNKINSLLKKGKYLTFSEIEYLRSQEVSVKEIAKVMGIGAMKLGDLIKKHKEGSLKDVSRAVGDLKEAKRLLSETDMTVPQIAQETGCNEHTVYYHSSKIRKGKKPQKGKAKVVSKTKYDQLKSEYDQLLKKSEDEKERLQKKIRDKDEDIAILKTQMTYLENEIKEHKAKPKSDENNFVKNELEKIADKVDVKDNVNSPAHYTNGDIEVIDYIKDKLTLDQLEGYCIGNVIKYVSRYQHKGGIEDLKKASVYLGWTIKTLEDKANDRK